MVNIANIVLEYIKALIWPLVLVVAFTVYGDELFNIIKNREIDAFGLKLGKQIDDISKNYQEELDSLKENIKEENGNEALLEKLDGIGSNLGKELSQVQSSALQQTASLESLSKREAIARLERKGFESIINLDVNSAIDAFTEANRLWPDYHNVSEIRKLLIRHQQDLLKSADKSAWKEVVMVIIKKYSWGIPKDIRGKLRKFIA